MTKAITCTSREVVEHLRRPQHEIDAMEFANANPRYVRTATNCVWFDNERKCFILEDETNRFMDEEYPTEEIATVALIKYQFYTL